MSMQKHYKILLGGSPCTYWSISQSSDKRETTASGIGWELFENYLYARDKFKPDFFLYENNKSAAQAIKDQIAKELGVGVDPKVRFTYINSALVSAQNRQRFYVTNFGDIEQPEDRGILLKDILDTAEPVCVAQHGGGQGGKTGLYACPVKYLNDKNMETLMRPYGSKGKILHRDIEKTQTLMSAMGTGGGNGIYIAENWDGKTYPVYEVKNGLIEIKGKSYPIKLQDGFYIIRKLTVNECRRLQTIPDWYKMPCSASQNYKMLGNGWTIEVIKHILSHIPNIANCTIEVLSMYSGMNCDLITLTELGANVVRCVDYEIDKYAIQTASANFPCIEHRGDAFQLRNANWSY